MPPLSAPRAILVLDTCPFLSRKYKKKIILFAEGDSDREILIPNAIIFRTSQYRYKKKKNEIMMPTQIFSDDILNNEKFVLRSKQEKPKVSFCGWADFENYRQKLKYFYKLLLINAKKYFMRNKYLEAHKQGIYFRRKAMQTLTGSPLLKTSFIARDFFSANKNTIKLPYEILRNNYIENIVDSDFVLSPKGDGNYSVRFYETLALGRIPVLINTECVLPLEDKIDYK